MPVDRTVTIFGIPDRLGQLCKMFGRDHSRYMGYVLILIPANGSPDNPVQIETDAPDRERLNLAVRLTSEILEGKR